MRNHHKLTTTTVAPEEIKEELKKASSNDEHDGMFVSFLKPLSFPCFPRGEDMMDTDGR